MLEHVRGFVFDLDGCVWNGNTLNPGAGETLARLAAGGRGVAFLTNNSRATAADILDRLHALGVTSARHALTPLDILGTVLTERFGRSKVLVIGAPETLTRLVAAGRGVAFLTNNSRATAANILTRLHALGVSAAEHAFTPLEIIGDVVTQRFGPSRVLVIGAAEVADKIARAGHQLVAVKDYATATAVAVGNDFDLTYERLTAACRVAATTGRFITPNVDPRLPIEGGDFLPGCGTLVAAVRAGSGVEPVVVGKPEPPLFRMALERLGVVAGEAAMVGDSVASDIRGGRGVGMRTVLYAPDGASDPEADVTVRSFAELARLAGV